MQAAVDAMKQVALHINEQKRRMENIGKIGKWQEGIDNWKVSSATFAGTVDVKKVDKIIHRTSFQSSFIR